MNILIDSREQRPFSFRGLEDVHTEIASLPTGDYSLAGFEHKVAIERKSLQDLVGCIGAERKRFEAELYRARALESFAIVVESPFSELLDGHYRGKLNPNSAVQSMISWQARLRIPVFWARNRVEAERYTFHFLRHYLNGQADALKDAFKAQGWNFNRALAGGTPYRCASKRYTATRPPEAPTPGTACG